MTAPLAVALVAGTRPNFVKTAPLFHAMQRKPSSFSPLVWVVQQHGAPALNDEVRADLGIGGPAVRTIEVAGTNLGSRLGSIVDGLAEAFLATRPDLVVVFGDVDTTLAGAIAAKRLRLPLAHVEAGLRSRDRSMPEELNRLMVDAVSDVYFTTSEEARHTLVSIEGHPDRLVHHVGNLMIDSLLATADAHHGEILCGRLGVTPDAFALATFHRPANVDDATSLTSLLDTLKQTCERIPVVFPLHPRTAAALDQFGLHERARRIAGLHLIPPLRYRDFVSVLACSRLVLTDSGGLQEETSILGIPCLTVRSSTERPVTLDAGSNRLVTLAQIAEVVDDYLKRPKPSPARIPFWDGSTAIRITGILEDLRVDLQTMPHL